MILFLALFLLCGIALYDWYTWHLPNYMLMNLLLLRVVSIPELDFFSQCLQALSLGAAGLFILWGSVKINGYPALGGGDIKLLAIAGLWIPLTLIPCFLILSGVGGLFTWGYLLFIQPTGLKDKNSLFFPFAPALCFALAFCLLIK